VKGGNFIGDSLQVNVEMNGIFLVSKSNASKVMRTPVDSVNFHLKIYNDMNITRLLGFPIEVTNLSQTGNAVHISGVFTRFPANPIFAPDSGNPCKPSFSSITIQPGTQKDSAGIPLAVPVGGSVTTEEHAFDCKVNGTLFGTVKDPSQLKVVDLGNGIGALTGTVCINASSFGDASVRFIENGFSLALPNVSGAGRMQIAAFPATGTAPFDASAGIPAVNASGGSIAYELFGPSGFSVTADSSASFIKGDVVHLASKLHTNLQHATPPKVDFDIGDVVLHTDKLDPINGSTKIVIPLEKWSLESEDWALSKYGGFTANGTLKTGKADVPFYGLQIQPTQFVSTANTFKLNAMTLSGLVPITVTGNPYFGYDPGQGHWSISLAPKAGESSCGYLSNLPGMKNGDRISLSNFFILSSGDDGFAIDQNTPSLTFFDVATFKPTALIVYSTYLHIPGTMDLHIPNVPGQSTAIDFQKNSMGNLALSFQPFPFGFAVNGVSLSFLANGAYPEHLDYSGFTARGTVGEEGKYSFDVMLHRTKDSTSLWIEPKQEFKITASGSSKLTGVTGTMQVVNNAWTNLFFSGDLNGTEGATGRLSFTVVGDITASQQCISLQNIPTPFGNIALIIDFEHRSLRGTVDFSQGINLGGAMAKGTADVLIDSDGWYFLTCGTLSLAGVEAQTAMIFGSYPVTPFVTETFKKYSWVYQNKGAFPPSFPTTVKGFYMEGLLQIPVLVPTYEFNFLLVSASVHVNVGADIRLAMNFYETASLGMGVTAYGQVGAGVGATVGIACGGMSASAMVDCGFDGLLYRNGEYLVQGDIGLQLCGSAYCGWGVCDSDCDGMFCDESDETGCIDMGLRGTVSNSGMNLGFYFK
jgi:hypothetical protein